MKYHIDFADKIIISKINDELEPAAYRIIADENIIIDGRIAVRKGDKGGYVQGYHNLIQQGTCWIYDDAFAAGNTMILDNAQIHGDTGIYNSSIMDDVQIYGTSVINECTLYDHSLIIGSNYLHKCNLFDSCSILGGCYLTETEVMDKAIVFNYENLDINHAIGGNAYITSNNNINFYRGTAGFYCGDITVYTTLDKKIEVRINRTHFPLDKIDEYICYFESWDTTPIQKQDFKDLITFMAKNLNSTF
jgi:hypothetical protein